MQQNVQNAAFRLLRFYLCFSRVEESLDNATLSLLQSDFHEKLLDFEPLD